MIKMLYEIRNKVVLNKKKFEYWYKYSSNVRAPLWPFELYWVSPDKIQRYPKKMIGDRYGPLIAAGHWDQNLCCYADRTVHTSFVQRFVKNKDWSETPLYKELNKRNLDKKSVESDLRGYDTLFKDIKSNGYKTQTEVSHSRSGFGTLPYYNEIQVDVTREGELVFFHGQHRLSIAKILELDSIPVMIRLRHKIWQQNRNEIFNESMSPSNTLSHPDLRLVSNRSG
jgi:hypothetical protein